MARTLWATDDDAMGRRASAFSLAGPLSWFADTLGAGAGLVADNAVANLSSIDQSAVQNSLASEAGGDQFVLSGAPSQPGAGGDAVSAFTVAVNAASAASGDAATSLAVSNSALDEGSFDADLVAAMSGVLSANDRVVFNPEAGSYAGYRFLIVDVDGVAGYTPGVDSAFMIGFL